jgi:hypothetical protein
VVAAGTAGVIGGRLTDRTTPVAGPTVTMAVTMSSAASQVPGTSTATATDARTGARLSVTVVPADEWVRLSVTAAGIRQGERCRLVVVDQDGKTTLAGSWVVFRRGADEGTTVQRSAAVARAEVAAVRVETADGGVLVTTPIRRGDPIR